MTDQCSKESLPILEQSNFESNQISTVFCVLKLKGGQKADDSNFLNIVSFQPIILRLTFVIKVS